MPEQVSEQMVRVVAYIAQVYHETSFVPTNAAVSEYLRIDEKTLKGYWKRQIFRDALGRRGVKLNKVGEDAPVLTFVQQTCIEMMLNTYDRRSMREKLEELDIKPAELNRWMQDPQFASHLRILAQKRFENSDSTAFMAVIKAMENGDIKATQLYLEMREIYNPRIEVNINVDNLLTSFVEIVTRHVQDPDILMAIASDLEKIPGVGSSQSQAPRPIETTASLASQVPELTI